MFHSHLCLASLCMKWRIIPLPAQVATFYFANVIWVSVFTLTLWCRIQCECYCLHWLFWEDEISPRTDGCGEQKGFWKGRPCIIITYTVTEIMENVIGLKLRMYICKSRDSSVGIALGYVLDDWNSRVRFPVGAGNFSLHHRIQNDSGALLSNGYQEIFPWG
jgi:hypothetical protein